MHFPNCIDSDVKCIARTKANVKSTTRFYDEIGGINWFYNNLLIEKLVLFSEALDLERRL